MNSYACVCEVGKHVTAACKQRGCTPPNVQTLADISRALSVPATDFFDDSILQEPSNDQKQALLDQLLRVPKSLDENELKLLLKLSVAVKSEP